MLTDPQGWYVVVLVVVTAPLTRQRAQQIDLVATPLAPA
jgi:hypothetical protein